MYPTKLEDLRALLAANLTDRAAKEARVDEITAAVEARADKQPTDAETAEFVAIRAAVVALDADKPKIREAITAAEARVASDLELEQLAATIPSRTVTAVGGAIVRSEERTYRKQGQHSFLRDLYARDMRRGDRDAEERLYRHEKELQVELRDTIVSGLAGMIPPVYLTSEFAKVARAGRPFLNSLTSRPLPNDGVSFVIPRGTTSATGGFVTEGAAFIEVDSTVANDNPLVQLMGAYSDISRTVFERGGGVDDDIIFPELMELTEVAEDSSAIVGTSTTLGFYGVLANVSAGNKVAYTDASPTVAELWPKLADAVQRINSNRYLPATTIWMHPRRWGWLTAGLDTANRPLFNYNFNATVSSTIGVGTATEYGQVVGQIMGLPVVTDANIPTTWSAGVASSAGTEDVIIIGRQPDIYLWEDSMMRFTFEQAPNTAPGQVRLAAGRFGMFHAGRYPTGLATVSGTGMVTPTF